METFDFLDAISQNFASNNEKRRQMDDRTYEQYQQEQKRGKIIKWVRFQLLAVSKM